MLFENKYMSVEQFLRKISGQEKEAQIIDHNYVKPWNAHPDSHRTKPARLIFMKGLQRYPQATYNLNENEEIDIESCDDPITSPFDNTSTRKVIDELERNLQFSAHFSDVERKAEELDLDSCDDSQKKLYQKVINIVNSDRLAKLTFRGTVDEPLKRRIATDKTARQLRQIFGMVFWDVELLSWLHKKLLSSDVSTMISYVEILQTLRAKVPLLVDKILQACIGFAANDTVIQHLKKPWDPVLPILSQHKPKKLPGNPIILICPSSPNQQVISSRSPRLRFWHSNLSSMCKVMNIPMTSDDGFSSTIEDYLEQIMSSIKNKVTELKNHYPNRPLILLGWTIGGLIACHIALQAPVDAIISLGFPLTGVKGSRGDLNDPLLDNQAPTLFVVGQLASMCSTDDIEDFRSRMRAETGLVIVGGADDMLRMCPVKMKKECVTQTMVDRCILDEVSEFLMSIVVKMPSVSTMASAKVCTPIMEEEADEIDVEWKPEDEGKRKRRKPREYSPELSPVRKRPRHHASKQAPSSKTRNSPSSSDTSSSASTQEKSSRSSKKLKKLQEKRSSRQPVSNWRKRQASKSLRQAPKTSHLAKEGDILSQNAMFMEDEEPAPKSIAKEVPFSKNILPKKNDPVDVEKAFGRDSSFLPRPLTPPEPEDTVSAEETEEALAELEAMAKGPSAQSESMVSFPSNVSGTPPVTKEVTFSTVLDQPIMNSIAESIKSASAGLDSSRTEDAKSTQVSSPAPTIQTVFPPSKFFSKTPLSVLKSSGGISLLTTNQTTSASSVPKSTIITVPSPSAATILVSNSAFQSAQPAKMIQLVKGSFINKTKKADASTGESSEQQSCNLSLLSDVAGMSEQLSNKKEPHYSPSATLVKLANPERVQLQSMKLKVVKASSSPSPPVRVETAEEVIEKQLAIQALNKSIGVETPSSSKESGYSICYTKADGTVVSHTITRPTTPSTVSRPGMSSLARGRGRVAPFRTGNPFRFFE